MSPITRDEAIRGLASGRNGKSSTAWPVIHTAVSLRTRAEYIGGLRAQGQTLRAAHRSWSAPTRLRRGPSRKARQVEHEQRYQASVAGTLKLGLDVLCMPRGQGVGTLHSSAARP